MILSMNAIGFVSVTYSFVIFVCFVVHIAFPNNHKKKPGITPWLLRSKSADPC